MSFGSAPTDISATRPPFKQVDITSLANQYEAYANLGFNTSDADFLARFPGLVATRNAEIKDITKQISGPLDPTVQNAFASSSEAGALSAFGGPTGSVGGPGSAARGSIASGIANQVQTKQDYDWSSLEAALNAFPERSYTLDPSTALNFMIGNVVGQNQSNFAGYTSALQNAQANQAATTQNIFGGAQIGLSILAIAL